MLGSKIKTLEPKSGAGPVLGPVFGQQAFVFASNSGLGSTVNVPGGFTMICVLLCVSESSQLMRGDPELELPPVHRSMWRSLLVFQSASHSTQSSSIMKYFCRNGA